MCMIWVNEPFSTNPTPTYHHAGQQLAAQPQPLEPRPAATLWEVLAVAAHVCSHTSDCEPRQLRLTTPAIKHAGDSAGPEGSSTADNHPRPYSMPTFSD